MSYAVSQNLPIFRRKYIIPYNDRYYIKARMGFDTYLGCLVSIGKRKDYFAYVDEFDNGIRVLDAGPKNGRLGRLDSTSIIKSEPWVSDSIFLEVIPNNSSDFTEFVPKLKSGHLTFTKNIEVSFSEWIKFMKK